MQDQKQLVRPIPWPPPKLDHELPEYTGALRRVPILNLCVQHYLKWKKKSDWWNELYRIEEEIIKQLKQREGLVPEYPSQLYQEIVALLSQAMTLEKMLESPVLLPDDELALLIWGPYDDMTLLEFRLMFEKKYSIQLPRTFFVQFLSSLETGLTLNDFVASCMDVVASNQKQKSLE